MYLDPCDKTSQGRGTHHLIKLSVRYKKIEKTPQVNDMSGESLAYFVLSQKLSEHLMALANFNHSTSILGLKNTQTIYTHMILNDIFYFKKFQNWLIINQLDKNITILERDLAWCMVKIIKEKTLNDIN